MKTADLEKLEEQAREAGADHGRAAASWYFDGNTPKDTYASVLQGVEDGDPEVLDSFPCSPLSGEWADDPTPQSVLRDLGDGEEWDSESEPDAADALLSAYEEAFDTAVHDSIESTARRMLN